jgi:hypothetical protein
MTARRASAVLIAGIAGGIAWILAMMAFFGPAQAVLADPERQSAKFLSVMGALEPLPKVTSQPWILPAGILALAVIHAAVYGAIRDGLRGGRFVRGLKFGAVAWALMAPWFEFYLPWNAMHEPALLVALELACWLLVLLAAGAAIGSVYEWRIGRSRPA